MGCCFSTKNSQNSEQKPNPPSPNHHHFPISNTTHLKDPPPPPPPLEEEAVKEVVLSEVPIPIPIPKPPDCPSLLEFNKPPIVDPEDSDPVNLNNDFPLDVVVEEKSEENSEVFSEISDFASQSVSTTTATTTILRREKEEYGEEEEVMSQKLEKPVPKAKVFRSKARSGDAAQRKMRAPSKRPLVEQRKNPRRGNVGPTGSRRVPGVGGGRGLKSPVIAGGERSSSNVVGRSSSMRMRSGGTAGSSLLKSPPVMAEKENSSGAQVEEKRGEQDSVLASESLGESLENPLVSFECFIFL